MRERLSTTLFRGCRNMSSNDHTSGPLPGSTGLAALTVLTVLATAILLSIAANSAQAALASARAYRMNPLSPPTPWQEMTVVIANRRVPDSVKLAKEYMTQRSIPRANYFEVNCTSSEVISRKEFESKIWKPLVKWALDQEYLERVNPKNHPYKMNSSYVSGILWFVTVYGVPLRIAEHYKPGETAPHKPSQRNAASVDSELATFPIGPGKLAGPIPNPLYSAKEEYVRGLHEPGNDVQTLVSRLDGPTYKIARSLIDRADGLKRVGLGGKTYIDARGLNEGVRQPLDAQLIQTARQVELDGVGVVLDTDADTFGAHVDMPSPAAYIGWSAPHVNGPFLKPDFHFWPGAIAYHLHPWSAVSVRTKDRFWVGPLLARGAGFVIGHVFDPGLDGYLRPAAFLHSMTNIKRGQRRTMDAAWGATPYLSWSTVIIGDPICQPFTGSLEGFDRLYESQDPGGAEIVLRPKRWRLTSHPTDPAPVRQVKTLINEKKWEDPDLYEFLGNVWATRPLRSIDSCYRAYQRAAELSRSPQQRTRVRLASALALLSVTNRDMLDQLHKAAEEGRTDPVFLRQPREIAIGLLNDAITQYPKEPATAGAYSLLARLYGEMDLPDKRLQVYQKLAANLPATPEGRAAAGELWLLDRKRPNPVETLTANAIDAPPTVDGSDADPAWQAANVAMPAAMKAIGTTGVPSPIDMAAARDDTTLYLLVKCPATALTEAELYGRVELPQDDRVEIFLSPKRDYKTAYRLLVTRGGGVIAHRDDGTTWIYDREKVQLETGTLPDGGWTVEIAIPFAEFAATPAAGQAWGLNFRRQRVIKETRRMDTVTTSWTGRYGDLSEAKHFGYLLFP